MADTVPSISPSRTTCASLLHELQIIWDEIGESDGDRDKMLLQLEQECLDIYCRKVERTRKHKAELHQSLADAEAEITNLISALGENKSFSRGRGTLKEQIAAIQPVLESLRLMKKGRMEQFSGIQNQISLICEEIAGVGQAKSFADPQFNERDLTVKKLGELQSHLQELQNEKTLRLQKVNNSINTICELSAVMSLGVVDTLKEIHPSLVESSVGQPKSISNDTLASLTSVIRSLRQEKQQRLQKLQELANTLLELWNLMEIPVDEQKAFSHVTCLVSSLVEVSMQGCLSLDVITQTETEVEKLNVLKVTKMKDLVFKRHNELEEICRAVHMDVDSDAARQTLINLIESGNVDMSDLLASMDDQIKKAKEQALSRRDILDKVDKWKFAFEEEKWLDDYERDENRYSAGRGVHKNLKRAEKARILVSKLPSIVENLTAKVKAWEKEKGIPFLYDKVALLHSLEEYITQRQEREEEKRKVREQKRLQEQLAVEQEMLFGSKPSAKKPLGPSNNINNVVGTPVRRRVLTPNHPGSAAGKERRESGRVHNIIPVNYVALAKDDSASTGS